MTASALFMSTILAATGGTPDETGSSRQVVTPPAPVFPVPSPEQLAWHELGYYAFVHFNMNTFTGREWGEGSEAPSAFNPSELDARQWVRAFRDAGMRGVIITAKHHDGFCLWPSAHTNHSVKSSPWRSGRGDLLRELSDACRAEGLLVGVYLSPWDRNHPDYGDSPAYNEFFRQQLREVCTNYGPLFEVWFDGACGEGPTGKRQVYDWPSYHAVVRETQPQAVMFSDAGPDVRWVGNERGYGSETNWAPFRRDEFYPGIPGKEVELGHGHSDGTHWVPAEVDVSIRPGWYWRRSENERVKSLRELEEIWYASLGRGCNLLLNVPADRRGLIPEPDVERLLALRRLLDATFANNLARDRPVIASNTRGGSDEHFGAAKVVDGDPTTYWATDDAVRAASLELVLDGPQPINRVSIREFIVLGQRVEAFAVDARADGAWHTISEGTTIGPRRIVRFPTVVADAVRVRILGAKASPTIAEVEVYSAPPEVRIDASDEAFTAATTVVLSSDFPDAHIVYTLDGSEPLAGGLIYAGPLLLTESTTIRARAFQGERGSLHAASVHVTKFDPALFREPIALFTEPSPGLRMERFDASIQTLEEFAHFSDRAPAETVIVPDIALPKHRPADDFALRYSGYIEIPKDGVYTFSLFSDDGSRLFIDDTQIVDRDGGAVWELREGRIPLRAGWHRLRVEYFEMKGEERLRVRWSGPGFRDEAIPASVLSH